MKCCSARCSGLRTAQILGGPKKLLTLTCDGCGVDIQRYPSGAARAKMHFHSQDCRKRYYAENTRDLDKLRDVVWERDAGRCTLCGSVRFTEVHHRDGDHKNNRLDNLTLLCKRCHVHVHMEMNGGKGPNAGKKRVKDPAGMQRARDIRDAAAAGMTHGAIADRYGMSRENVSIIVRNETWIESA